MFTNGSCLPILTEQINLALDCVQRQKISTSYLANVSFQKNLE